jgi:hypothetical protein
MQPYFTPPGFTAERSQLNCPPAAQGQTTNSQGDYDPATVANAVHVSGIAWALSITLVVVICYNWTRLTMSHRFVIRWWLFLVAGAVVGAAAVATVLSNWQTTADANTCQSDPRAFAAPLPGNFVWAQGAAAAIYGALLFFVLSVLLSQILGRFAHHRNGFFNNRGCPIPRALP